jgi:hypothetical protein
MYAYENTTATTISAVNEYHAIFENIITGTVA